MFLRCNNLRCRAELKHQYCVTKCKHIFCAICALQVKHKQKCLRCKASVFYNIAPRKYAPINLCGYSLGYIHDIVKEATDFFMNQMAEETEYLKGIAEHSPSNQQEQHVIKLRKHKKVDNSYSKHEHKYSSDSNGMVVSQGQDSSVSYVCTKKLRSTAKHNKKEIIESESTEQYPLPFQFLLDKNLSDEFDRKLKNYAYVAKEKNKNYDRMDNSEQDEQKEQEVLLPENIKTTRKLILTNLIKSQKLDNPNGSEDTKEDMPKYVVETDEQNE